MCNICSIWTISRQFGIVRLRIFLYLWERNCKNVQSAYDIKKYIKYPLRFSFFTRVYKDLFGEKPTIFCKKGVMLV